jgi:hypothetical protein
MYRGAMRSILSELVAWSVCSWCPSWQLEAPKTKEVRGEAGRAVRASALIVVESYDDPCSSRRATCRTSRSATAATSIR